MGPQGLEMDEPGLGMISAKLAKAMANEWRCRIIGELSVRPMSPSEFVEHVGGELTTIARCFRQLAEWDYVEVIEERKGGHRRGATEKVYRKTKRGHIETPAWERLPQILRDDITNNFLTSYLDRIQEAVEAETIDVEDNRHLSWDWALLDRQAFDELMDRLDEVLAWIPMLALEAAERMAASGEEPIPTTVGLTGFRGPMSREKPGSRIKHPPSSP
jgi:DNA-binding PadR family transcriptional regulator